MPRTIFINSLAPSDGAVIQIDNLDIRLAAAGDVNGDGIDDFLIGTTPALAGNVFVFFGKPDFASTTIVGLASPDGFVIREAQVVSGAGDINGDGFADVLVGNEFRFGQEPPTFYGSAYVALGKAGGFATVDARTLAMPRGFEIIGGFDDRTGFSVTGGIDMNNDGFDDFLVGSRRGAGFVDLIYGKASGFTDVNAGFAGTGHRVFSGLGAAVAAAGDINGDGYGDALINSAGAIRVLFGDSGAPQTITLTHGGEAYSNFGGAGDVNGDGYDDIIVESNVIFGRPGAPGSVFPGTSTTSLAATQGFSIAGDVTVVAAAGDVNGDGYDDIVVTDTNYSPGGRAWVVFGRPSGLTGTIDVNALGEQDGFTVVGDPLASFEEAIGYSAAAAGDINDDGYDDVLLGTQFAYAYVIFGPGWHYVVGTDPGGETLTGTPGNDNISGLDGADQLIGLAGGDRLYGNGGDDIVRPGTGADLAEGGAGNDMLDYSGATGAVYASLFRGVVHETALATGTVSFATARVSTDTAAGFEHVTGSAFGDRIYGDTGNNVIAPGAGNDIAYGLGADDTLDYSAAAGAIFASLAGSIVYETSRTAGTVVGGATMPVVSSDYGIGFNRVTGSSFGDRLYGDSGSNLFDGGAGDDVVYGGDGHDTLGGGGGNDVLVGGSGGDTIGGDSGLDTLIGGPGGDVFYWVDAATERDIVIDFDPAGDALHFNAANFGYSVSDDAVLVANAHPSAASANSFLYDTDNGVLSFDTDGPGGAEAVAIAWFQGLPALSAADILFY